jgi:hypothetical protein
MYLKLLSRGGSKKQAKLMLAVKKWTLGLESQSRMDDPYKTD